MTQHPPVTRSGAQRAAQHELSKAIYRHTTTSIPQRALNAVGRFIDWLLGHATRHAPGGDSGALALVVIIAVMAIVIIWRVGIPRRAVTTGTVLESGRAVTAADHRHRAELAAAAGDWNTAVIERMRAIARQLEESAVIGPRAGRTASELADEAAAQLPSLAAQLRRCAGVFNAVAYGGQLADASQLEGLVATDTAIRSTARSTVTAQ